MSEEAIKYRQKRAIEALEECKVLLQEKMFLGAVNRMYYALFYEITALLLAYGFSSSKHSGVLSFFQKEFVKEGKISVEQGKFFARLFSLRQKADYGDFCEFEEAEVQEWYKEAEKFIEAVEKLIPQSNGV